MSEPEISGKTASPEKYAKVAAAAILGHGAQGVVKLFKRNCDGKLLARKKIRYREPRYLELEYESLKKFSHANITDFVAYEHDRDKQYYLLYMEYCLYGDLSAFFSQRKNTVTENVLWQVLFQVASALAYCHHGVGIYGNHFTVEEKWDGIVHRDIKPKNVLVSSWENGRIVVKICDFGVSKQYSTTTSGTGVGTHAFTEPNVSDGWAFKSDIYSLGCTTRALCKLNQNLIMSPKLEKVISKCEEKDRSQRYCTITLLHSIPAECSHVPDGFQAKNSIHWSPEGPHVLGFPGHLLATVANVGSETKRLQRLVDDLDGDEDLGFYYRNAVQYSQEHNYQAALPKIFEFSRKMVNGTAKRPRNGTKQLRLLSLDGSGVRGLTSLFILNNLMKGINPDSPPKPCDIFDLIGGTNTGGLIAVMLGRLRMDVESCIKAYCELSRQAFEPKTQHWIFSIWPWNPANLEERFSSQKLEEIIKQIIQHQRVDKDSMLLDTSGPNCRVFVCATRQEVTQPICLRSYHPRTPKGIDRHCKIWEACRATTAIPTFFDPVRIGQFDEYFLDGAPGCNNPVNEVFTEALDLWPDARIQCLISIGTGQLAWKHYGNSRAEIAETLSRIATETEKTAETFLNSHRALREEGSYFRINPPKGLEDVGLEEYKKIKVVAKATDEYLQGTDLRKEMEHCVSRLRGGCC